MPDCAALVGAAAAWFNDGGIANGANTESVSAVAKSDGV
jgi:hypothetical protein